MHVFSLGRFCASPKPSPRGEDAELCSPDAVEASRLPPAVPVSRRVPVPRHKPSPRGEDAELCSPDAVEASRPLRRRRSRAASCVISCFQSSMLLHNLSSVFSLGKKASQRALRSSRVLLRTIATAHPAASPAPRHSPASRPAPRHSPVNRPAPRRSPASLPSAGPIPRCGRFSTDFPQSFPHFRRFPTAAFFPLGFLRERQGQIF